MKPFVMNHDFQSGRIINGLKNKIWTERYSQPGEFKFVTTEIERIRELLPLDALISHTETLEVAVVEDHEIKKVKHSAPELTVSGRTFESLMEGRVTLPNLSGSRWTSAEDYPNQYVLSAKNSWEQAVDLITDQMIDPEFPFWPDHNVFPNLSAYSVVGYEEGTQVSRIIEPGQLDEKVYELLKISNSGIMSRRPTNPHTTLDLVVHLGRDRSHRIIFVENRGELEEVSYFWTTRGYKNGAIAVAKFDTSIFMPGYGTPQEPRGRWLRWQYVDANTIEDDTDPTIYQEQISARAEEGLAPKQKRIITSAKIPNNSKFVYNKHYFIGDLVGIVGDYNISQAMRVTEYTWSDDENKSNNYATLSPVDEI